MLRLLATTLCGCVLAPAAPALGAMLEAGGSAPPPPPRVVAPLKPTGYGEWAARYGSFRNGHAHEGQDAFAPEGTPLRAVRDAVVVARGNDGGRGNHLGLYSTAARETYVYFHMARPARVRVGERVSAGQRVGAVGCTGSCSGDHLHFEIRRGRGLYGRSRDPLPLMRRAAALAGRPRHEVGGAPALGRRGAAAPRFRNPVARRSARTP